jgi:hypothetical protein
MEMEMDAACDLGGTFRHPARRLIANRASSNKTSGITPLLQYVGGYLSQNS